LALLPGLLNDAALWKHQIEALSDMAECHVADMTQDDHVSDMAERVLAAMPEQFALAGLSMGGYVSFEIMRRAPHRVTRLALLDTKARPDTEEQTARRRGLIELAQKGDFKGVTTRLLPQLIHPDHVNIPDVAEEVMGMASRVGRDAFLRQQKAIMSRPDSRPTLARIPCPTVVLCGAEDALTPQDLHREMAAGIHDARLHIVDHCGHLAPLEQPAKVSAVLRGWLQKDRE
jgi:pimeloyl-ACP methyl ester carboxylesterase